MELDDIKKQALEYFDKVSPEKVIEIFEKMGCEFENIEPNFVCDKESIHNEEKCKTECDWCKYWNNYLENNGN